MRNFLRIGLALGLLALGGCHGSGSGVDLGDGGTLDLVIEPSQPVLFVENGEAEPIDFVLLRDDQVVDARWSLSNRGVGRIDTVSGRFTANAVFSGLTTVTATVDGASTTTTLTIRIENTRLADGVPTDAPDRFSDDPLSGDPESPALLYPLDEAVIPSSIKPPMVQWEGGAEDDLYRVEVSAGLAKVTAYFEHTGSGYDYAWPVDDASWAALVQAGLDNPLSVVVDRWVSATSETFRSETRVLTVAPANLDGAIYYWDLSDGRILRITKEGREDFMPSPPPRPSDGRRCVACHTVSRDGRFMATELWGGNQFGAVFDLSEDLSVDPAPTAVPPDTYKALFSTFNPDASRLLTNIATKLELRDATTGALLPTFGTALPITGAAQPTWSPDGTLIAYIANHDGRWAVDFTLGDVAVIPVTALDTFDPTIVLRAADGKANSWPSFSPDSEWIAYARGEHSRGRRDDLEEAYPGSLRMMHREGGEEFELAKANGAGENSHLPNFSPFDDGGYFWLAFYSTRDYGNAHVGTKGQARRQIWVTAISNEPQTGTDPSHVPYWLPDQDPSTHNMSAYWTLPPPPVVE